MERNEEPDRDVSFGLRRRQNSRRPGRALRLRESNSRSLRIEDQRFDRELRCRSAARLRILLGPRRSGPRTFRRRAPDAFRICERRKRRPRFGGRHPYSRRALGNALRRLPPPRNCVLTQEGAFSTPRFWNDGCCKPSLANEEEDGGFESAAPCLLRVLDAAEERAKNF